jgi:hypothetical protein
VSRVTAYEAVLGDHLPAVVPGRLTDAFSATSRADRR